MNTTSNLPAVRQRIAFLGKQHAVLEKHPLESLAANEVCVETTHSLMSTGTENIVYNRAFAEGTHWDGWVKYPFYPGYASVGRVIAVGGQVSRVKVGDSVAFRAGHCSHANLKADECYPIPAALPLEQAVWFSLVKIAFMGLLAAEYKVGDEVLIVGAGPIGQMSVRWAVAAGCRTVVVVDPVASRLNLAKAGGATHVLACSISEAASALSDQLSGRRPRVVIDGTGNATVFNQALQLVADRGRVVILGDTGHPAQQTLTKDVITRGLSIVGAHDIHNTAEWNDRSINEVFFALAISNRFALEGLTSHRFVPSECAAAYQAANVDRGSTMGVIFDWTKSS